DELPDEDATNGEHPAGDEESPTDTDGLGDDATHDGTRRNTNVDARLELAHAGGESLTRDDTGHQRRRGRDRSREHALQNAQNQELTEVLHQPDQGYDQPAHQHRPEHHDFPAMAVDEGAPNGAVHGQRYVG